MLITCSAVHSKNLVSTCPTISVASSSANSSEYTALPSLAPLTNQKIEVNVLPTQESVDMNVLYGQREQDRRVRREIANSNERRRMQSINAGFKALKTILPQTAGEKLSKASILQQTAEYILQLDSDKTKLLTLNERFRTALAECKCNNSKRRALLSDGLDKDEGIGSPREEEYEDIHRDSVEMRLKLNKERRLRIELEKKVHELETKCTLHHGSCLLDSKSHLVIKPKSSSDHFNALPGIVSSPNLKNETTDAFFDKAASGIVTEYPHHVTTSTPLSQINTSSTVACNNITQDTTAKSLSTSHSKNATSLPRSSQPLKKRAVEMLENESPKTKISKIQINSAATTMVNVSSSAPGLPATSAPKGTVLVQHDGNPAVIAMTDPTQSNFPVALQPTGLSHIKQEKFVPTAGIFNLRPNITLPTTEQPLLLSATSSAAQTYITLSPASAVFSAAPVTWPEQQGPISAPNYSLAIAPSNPPAHGPHPQYVIQSALPRVSEHTEEITLNQLNAVPSLSMTLTQLNAGPTMARLNSIAPPGNTTLSTPRLQAHYLPVVAMDTVLSNQAERRMSSATTDSAPSEEESKSVDEQLLKSAKNLVTASSRRTKSDPGIPSRELTSKEVVLNASAPVPSRITRPTVSKSAGSPLYRHIDAAATRRNLETIVQAIDHLEQQERRNSQDQQTCNQ